MNEKVVSFRIGPATRLLAKRTRRGLDVPSAGDFPFQRGEIYINLGPPKKGPIERVFASASVYYLPFKNYSRSEVVILNRE